MGGLRVRLVALVLCGGALGTSAGCSEDDEPTSFLPPAPPPSDAGADEGMGAVDAGDSMEGASIAASFCQPGYGVLYKADNDLSAGTFKVTGTLSRSVDPNPAGGQISISVLTENPVLRYIGAQEPEIPVAQLIVRDCDWSTAGDTLTFTLENIPKKAGEDYYFASFYDTDKQARPLGIKSGFITAAVGLTDVPRLTANPSGDTVQQDLDLNTVVP